MSYVALTCCFNARPPIDTRTKPELLENDEKMAVITDCVIATLLIVAATLIILQANGFVDLGQLSGIGSIGVNNAYILYGIAGGVLVLDLLKGVIQQARHINVLFARNAVLNDESRIAQHEQALTEAEDRYQQEIRAIAANMSCAASASNLEYRQQLNNHETRIQVVEQERDVAQRSYAETKARLDQATEEFGRFEQAASEADRTIHDLRKRLNEAQASDTPSAAIAAEKAQLQHQLDAAKEQVTAKNAELEKANGAHAAEKAQLQQQLAAAKEQVTAKSAELDEANAAHAAEKAQLQQQLDAAKKEVTAKNAELEKANGAHADEKAQLQKALDAARAAAQRQAAAQADLHKAVADAKAATTTTPPSTPNGGGAGAKVGDGSSHKSPGSGKKKKK